MNNKPGIRLVRASHIGNLIDKLIKEETVKFKINLTEENKNNIEKLIINIEQELCTN